MANLLPDAYLLGLIGLLSIAAVAVARQILRVRGEELILSRLGGKDKGGDDPLDAASLYGLGACFAGAKGGD